MRDSVPSVRYSSVYNVLRQWRIWLIPIYRVYRLYDIPTVQVIFIICIDKTFVRFIFVQKSAYENFNMENIMIYDM